MLGIEVSLEALVGVRGYRRESWLGSWIFWDVGGEVLKGEGFVGYKVSCVDRMVFLFRF